MNFKSSTDQPDLDVEEFDFSDSMQPSIVESDLWIEGIVASHYGSMHGSCWGAYGNKLYPADDFFCALPANHDNLDYLGGRLGCRISRCDSAQPSLDELLMENPLETSTYTGDFEFWPGAGPHLGDEYSWVIEGTEGEGLFRVIEIKKAGQEGPIFEAYVGDVGPWCSTDTYWETNSRPDAEDGIDARGRRTNRAGIDVSLALAHALGFTGLMEVDWRWKTIDGAYVVQRRPTEWSW